MYDYIFKTPISSMPEIGKESEKWFKKHKKIKEDILRYIIGFDDLILIFPSTLESYGFLPPWIYLYHEANQEIESSIVLALSGMYKESLRTLRSFIELNLLSIYYFSTKDYEDFKKWLNGEKRTPQCKLLIQKILENNEKIKKLEQINWSESVYNIYKDLSKFVHTGGRNGSFNTLRDSNQIQFNERGLSYSMKEIILTLKYLSAAWVACFPLSIKPLPIFSKFAFNPPASGFFDYGQVDIIISMFKEDKKLKNLLSKIGDEDEESNSIAESILSLPNLKEKEIIKSFNNYVESIGGGEEKAKFLMSIKNETPENIITIINARQRAFLKATAPLLAERQLQ